MSRRGIELARPGLIFGAQGSEAICGDDPSEQTTVSYVSACFNFMPCTHLSKSFVPNGFR